MCTPDSECVRAGGFSLLEVLVFISVLGLGLWGILSVVQFNSLHSADAAVQKQALSIAEAIMEEKNEALAYAAVTSVATYPLPEHPGFSVMVTVTQPASWEGIANPDVKRVEVLVSATGGDKVALVTYRTNHP